MSFTTIGLTLILAGAASAATIQVSPGPGTLQAAIDAAVPGDRLVLADGLYDAAVVDVPGIRIKGLNPSIAGDPVALTIRADDVRLDGGNDGGFFLLGSLAGLVIENANGIRVQKVSAGDTSNESAIIVRASTRVTLHRVLGRAASYGLRLVDLPIESRILVRRSEFSVAGSVAIAGLIENCAPGAALRGARLSLKNSFFHGYPGGTALAFRNSDGIEVVRSRTYLAGSPALDLDATSDNNLFAHSSFDPCTINDSGSGNVFFRTIQTVPPAGPCP